MCNIEVLPIDIKLLASELQSYLQIVEDKELAVSVKNYRISIYPVNSIGDPIKDVLARPVLECRFDESTDTFILSWIYLINQKQGIGSEIVRIIKEFCRTNRITRFQIRAIRNENKAMKAIGEKFGFKVIPDNEEGFLHLNLEMS